MSAPPPLPPPTDQEARTRRHLQFLDTLIDQGMDLATQLHKQSTTPSELCNALFAPGIAVPFITPDVIAAFAQINQTIRRAILVSRKLAEPLAPGRTTLKTTTTNAEQQTQPGPEPAQAETIRAEHSERLQSPDLEDRIGARPIPEIIAGLCRDLGVNPERLNPEDAEAPIARLAPSIGPENDVEALTTILEREHRPPQREPPET